MLGRAGFGSGRPTVEVSRVAPAVIWRIVAAWLLLVLALAVYWLQLDRAHVSGLAEAESAAKLRAAQTVHGLALQVGTLIEKMDYIARHMADEWQRVPPGHFHDIVAVAQNALPEGALVQVAIADAHGDIVFSSLSARVAAAGQPVSIADREHFRVHVDAPDPQLYISRPLVGRISGQWTVQFSRPIIGAQGFEGVVVLSVSAEHLSRALRSIFPDPADVALLLREDGVYLARSHLLEQVLGKHVPSSRTFLIDRSAESGHYDVVAPVDGVPRFYAWRRAAGYPVLVSLGLSTERVLAGVRGTIQESRQRNFLGTLMLVAAAGLITWLVIQRSRQALALQRASERLTLALHGGDLGTWDWDCINDVAQVNPRWAEIYGTTPPECKAVFATWFACVLEEDRPAIKAAIDAHLRGDAEQYEATYRIRRHDGSEAWVLDRGRVVAWGADGEPLRAAGTVLDVTARKHAEEAEAALRTELAKLAAQVPGMMYQYLLRPDGTSCFPYASPGIAAMFGVTPEEAARSAEKMIRIVHPNDQQRFSESLRASAETLETWRCEFRVVRDDGSIVWFYGHANPERTREGATLWHGYVYDITARVEESQLRRALLEQSTAAIVMASPRREVRFANRRMHELFARPGERLVGTDLRRLHLNDANYQALEGAYERVGRQGEVRLEMPLLACDGRTHWFDMHGVLRDPADPDSEVVWTLIDITERHEVEAVLATERLRLTALLQRFPGGVLMEDGAGQVVVANPAVCDLLDLDCVPAELVGLGHDELVERLGSQRADWLQQPVDSAEQGERRRSVEASDARGRTLEIDWVPIRSEAEHLGRVWLLRDVSERKQREATLAALAATDALTGLPNRRSFMASLHAAIENLSARGEPTSVLLMLDIDHFKKVNDTFGHAAGDKVLCQAAEILRHSLRERDCAGRLGGEEFAVLVFGVGLEDGLALAERLRAQFARVPVLADEAAIRITVSVGATVLRHTDADSLLREADQALYAAKAGGRNRVCIWPV